MIRTQFPDEDELKKMQETFPSDSELKEMVTSAIIVDVRPPDEVREKGTSVPGSINIPFVSSEQDSFMCQEVVSMLPLDKNAIIITH